MTHSIVSSLSGNRYYEVSDQFSYRGAIFGGQNTKITFKAGNQILITANSIIAAGTREHAYIASCGTVLPED